MAKTVALDQQAYDLLRRSKRPGETFGDVVRRTLRPATKMLDLAGALSDVSAAEWHLVAQERQSQRRRDAERRTRIERGRRCR